MYKIFKHMAFSSIFMLTMFNVMNASAQSNSEPILSISKLTGYDGQGYCSVEQNGSEVKAVVKVINLTPGSTATAWLKFDGTTVGRLDGTVADQSGAAVFSRTFSVDSNVSSFLFDVRDHNRQLSSIVNDADILAELTQPSNLITGESIRMGTCTFNNNARSNTYADNFDSDGYSGNTGDTDFSTSWTEINDNGYSDSGDVRMWYNYNSCSIPPCVRIEADDGNEGVSRSVELSGGNQSATLTFDYHIYGGTQGVDVYFRDSQKTVWVERLTVASSGDGSSKTYDVGSYVDLNSDLTLLFIATSETDNRTYLDNVELVTR